MEIIDNYQKAFDIGQEYINKSNQSSGEKPAFDDPNIVLPPQVNSQKWQMTEDAFSNTLHYIFDKLSHSCYMLCIADNVPRMYKLESKTNSHLFDEATKRAAIIKLRANPLVTAAQKGRIMSTISEPVRIMQCIVKPVAEKGKVEIAENEYMDLLRGLSLPNGVFLLNLTDAVILRDNGQEPFPMVTGDRSLGAFDFPSHIPILSLSGQRGYLDIPIPNYDDLFVVLGKNPVPLDKFVTRWSKKTIDRAIFRGGPSGCGYTADTNMRVKLATMAQSEDTARDLDVGITGKGGTIDSNSIRFDPVHGLGMLNTGIKPADKFVSMIEQSHYKYIIHIDGNVNAYRLLTTMATGSLIIRVKSEYTSWVDHMINPNEHYVLVRADLSNLLDKIAWCRANDSKCRKIAQQGMEFARMALTRDFVTNTFQKILWSVGGKSRPKTPSPPKAKTPSPPKANTPSPPKAKTPSPPKAKTPSPPKAKTPSPSPKTQNKRRCPKGSRKNKKGDCIDANGNIVPPLPSPKNKGTQKKRGPGKSPTGKSPTGKSPTGKSPNKEVEEEEEEINSPKSKLSKEEIRRCHAEIRKHLL